MEAVLYKGGGPAMADVVAGHVPCYFGNLNEIIPHAGGGSINVLAVSGETRAPQLPQVPTVAEQGFPGFRTGHVERLRRARRHAARRRRAHRARDRRRLQGRRLRRAAGQDRRRPGLRHAGRVRAGDPRRPRSSGRKRCRRPESSRNEPARRDSRPHLALVFPGDRRGRARLLPAGGLDATLELLYPGDQDLRGAARRQARLRRRRLACGARMRSRTGRAASSSARSRSTCTGSWSCKQTLERQARAICQRGQRPAHRRRAGAGRRAEADAEAPRASIRSATCRSARCRARSAQSASFGLLAAKALEEGQDRRLLGERHGRRGRGAQAASARCVLDARRDGSAEAKGYTFPALVATEKTDPREPRSSARRRSARSGSAAER